MYKSVVTLERLKEAYAVYNQVVGKSPRTIQWYNQKLELFERFLGDGCELADFTLESARAYIADLQNRRARYERNGYVKDKSGTLSSAYIQGFARALRAFSTWLNQEGYTDTNVLQPLKPPRIQRKVIQPLTDEEVGRILGRLKQNDPYAARAYAMIWTLLDTGLRASELCGLRVEDMHIEKQGFLKVLGKGNKERLVPIGTRTMSVLLRWRDVFRPMYDELDSPYLFLAREGRSLTTTALQEVVKRAGRNSGVPRVHCHLLRHTFATNCLVKEVGDPLRLQQILGHETLEMVRHYVAMASVEQSLLERRASPMDLFAKTMPGRDERARPPELAGTEANAGAAAPT
ncbi:MAG: tyrosine-type recombinase/integrase [Dehalococcoidia bacterium]